MTPQGSQRPGSDALSKGDLLQHLQQQYQAEAAESMHQYQRCGFLTTAIVVVGAAATALANGQWILSRSPLGVLYAVALLSVFAALSGAALFLICAVRSREWRFAPNRSPGILLHGIKTLPRPSLKNRFDAVVDDEFFPHAVAELVEALEANRQGMTDRYSDLHRAAVAIVASVVMLGFLASLHGLLFVSQGAP